MQVTIGLDFGTYQSKVCLRINREGIERYEFIDFSENDNDPNYFLRSKVQQTVNNYLVFGGTKIPNAKEVYDYFKIASAEDEFFQSVSELDKSIYTTEWHHNKFSPEIISIIFLCYVIGLTKTKIREKYQKTSQSTSSSFLSKYIQRSNTGSQEIDFRIQMGIPTEYSKKVNRKRRRKFELILLMAVLLEDKISVESLTKTPVDQLLKELREIYNYVHRIKNKESWSNVLENYGLSIMPETAAGLIYLVKSGKVQPGYHYLALDVGGGSSDISFFKVEENKTFTYQASESVMIASNNVYHEFQKIKQLRGFSIDNSREYIEQQVNAIKKDEDYKRAFTKIVKKLHKLIYRIYNSRVYFRFLEGEANTEYENAICYFFGGGSKLPIPESNPEKLFERVLLHDNGVRDSFDLSSLLFAEIQPVEQLAFNLEINQDDWQKHLRTLVVALGLSLNRPADLTALWNDIEYTPGENYNVKEIDPGLYDVFRRNWV